MRRVKELSKGFKAIQDLDLLKVLKSEINFELAANSFQNGQNGSLGDFVVDWDSSHSKDVVLRKQYNPGEEVAVSAILGPPISESYIVYPREVFMKVCIKKPALSSLLQFDCGVYEESESESNFKIDNVYYIPSPTCLGSSIYRGPSLSTVSVKLQLALKDYLIAQGIGTSLTSFLLHYLHKREQEQYVNWLQQGESFLAKGK